MNNDKRRRNESPGASRLQMTSKPQQTSAMNPSRRTTCETHLAHFYLCPCRPYSASLRREMLHPCLRAFRCHTISILAVSPSACPVSPAPPGGSGANFMATRVQRDCINSATPTKSRVNRGDGRVLF